MFIDKEQKKQEQKIRESISVQEAEDTTSSNNLALYLALGFVAIVVVAVVFYFFVFRKPPPVAPPPPGNNGGTTTTTGQLPGNLTNGNGNGGENGTSTDQMSPEYLTFGHFYEEPVIDFKSTLESYELPINIKVDATNYYDISRKLNLDPYIDYINRDGFAVSSNQLGEKANDFSGVYRNLLEKRIPVVITTDFLFYYYQNILKQVYKDIEKNVFFENVWDMNKELFDISQARYKEVLSKVGEANDPILEGARLEAAYYAVALELLKPTESQINKKANMADDTKFNDQEIKYFVFDLPPYLEQDIKKEVDLIRGGKAKTKSPVLLLERDYKNFRVPGEYRSNAKLNNFYLATKWLNSVFPLYYQSNECPDCLLDQEDWTINLIAASLISHDLFNDQELKNKWAIIYKFISFFSGLKQDLTYLQYNEAFTSLFGEDYNVEEIFSLANENRDEDIKNIQKRIEEFGFALIEGSSPRDDQEFKPYIGMRMLQEPYWPNGYIMNYLVGKEMKSSLKKKEMTSCEEKGIGIYRCRGFGMDILNLVSPPEVKYDYFTNNTNYDLYNEKINELRKETDRFDINTWNNNIYWVTLGIAENLVDYKKENLPVFYYNDQWKRYKDYNSFLGAWVNLHLAGEKMVNYYDNEEASYLGGLSGCNFDNYIEPNLDIIFEMKAKNEMLIKMFSVLRVTEKTTAVANQLKELNSKLDRIIEIIQKELSNEKIGEEDCQFINSLIKNNAPEKQVAKTFTIDFGKRKLTESIGGIKLLIVVYEKDEDKIIAIGPVYNYFEK